MITDLTFITNEPPARRNPGAGGEANLLNRFKILIRTERRFPLVLHYGLRVAEPIKAVHSDRPKELAQKIKKSLEKAGLRYEKN